MGTFPVQGQVGREPHTEDCGQLRIEIRYVLIPERVAHPVKDRPLPHLPQRQSARRAER
jgi:hypothetical protein